MRLRIDGKSGNAGVAIRTTVKGQVSEINHKILSQGHRAANIIRGAEQRVLQGQRSGRRYRLPYTGNKTKEERKKSGYKSPIYTASAPGEPPARRMGMLQLHWTPRVIPTITTRGVKVTAALESGEKYAAILENGTSKMAPRPFVDKIKKEAMPEIRKIFSEPYT